MTGYIFLKGQRATAQQIADIARGFIIWPYKGVGPLDPGCYSTIGGRHPLNSIRRQLF